MSRTEVGDSLSAEVDLVNGRPYVFDKAGTPISMRRFEELKFSDSGQSEYARIGSDHVGDVWVSTVWLGIDCGFGADRPVIFETMVFGGAHDQAQQRYCTEVEALAGHRRTVAHRLIVCPGAEVGGLKQHRGHIPDPVLTASA